MTGRTDDNPPYGPEDPQEPPQAVLTGEVIPAGYLANDETGTKFGPRWRTGRLDEDDIADIMRKRHEGVPLRDLEKEYGISRTTICNWSRAHHGKAVQAGKDVAKIRAKLVVQLEAALDEAWIMFRENTHPVVKKDALARVESITRALAELQGAKVPVVLKTEVQITELTQEDLAAQAMIREAKAKTAAQRARVEAQFKGSEL